MYTQDDEEGDCGVFVPMSALAATLDGEYRATNLK
jgi:hypothetical protein